MNNNASARCLVSERVLFAEILPATNAVTYYSYLVAERYGRDICICKRPVNETNPAQAFDVRRRETTISTEADSLAGNARKILITRSPSRFVHALPHYYVYMRGIRCTPRLRIRISRYRLPLSRYVTA
jgi:hypothetical protein